VESKGEYVHDFELDSENATAELDQLEYPYNQEVSHRVVWKPFEDYLAAADVDQTASVDEQPQVTRVRWRIQDLLRGGGGPWRAPGARA